MSENYKFHTSGQDLDGNYTLYLTYKCNWFCDYCSEDTHNRPEMTLEDIQHSLEQIKPNSSVAITGGEPGLIDKEVMLMVLEHLKNKNCFININTNGTFFKKHRHLCHIPDSFLYHCTEHLEDDEIWIPEHIDFNKISFQLVVTDQTFHRIEYYLDKYPNIKFLIFGADQIQYGPNRRGTGLSRKNGFEIYKKFKDRIDPESYVHLILRCRDVIKLHQIQEMTPYERS